MTSKNKKTHFGFKEIEESEKAQMVRGVFSSVASKYDIMNDVMSLRKQIATIINNPYILESISKNIQDPVLFATISKSHSEMYKSLF